MVGEYPYRVYVGEYERIPTQSLWENTHTEFMWENMREYPHRVYGGRIPIHSLCGRIPSREYGTERSEVCVCG
jgi:hypothetical protein